MKRHKTKKCKFGALRANTLSYARHRQEVVALAALRMVEELEEKDEMKKKLCDGDEEKMTK